MFSAKISLTKTDRCAGALLWRRNQLLVLHFSERFLLTAVLRQQTHLCDRNFPCAAIPVNYTGEFRKPFETISITFILKAWHAILPVKTQKKKRKKENRIKRKRAEDEGKQRKMTEQDMNSIYYYAILFRRSYSFSVPEAHFPQWGL